MNISGKVASGLATASFAIHVWDRDLLCDDFLGSSPVAPDGTFTIEISATRQRELLDRHADLYFRVYRDGRLILDTRESTLWNVGSDVEVVLEIPELEGAPLMGHVAGRVRAPGGAGSPCARVALIEKVLRGERVLAEARADREGAFQLVYPRREGASPHLLVRVVRGERVLGESAVSFRAPAEAHIDVVVPEPASDRLLGAARAIDQVLGDVRAEDLRDEDVEFVARAAGVEEATVRARRDAAELAARTGLPPDVALKASAIDDRASELLVLGTDGLRARIEDARRRGRIDGDDAEISGLARQLESAAQRISLDAVAPEAGGSARAVLAPLGLSEAQIHRVALAFAASEDPFSILRADPLLAERADEVEDAVALGAMTGAHAPLVRALWAKRGESWDRAHELAAWSGEELRAAIGETHALPDALNGEDGEDREARAAHAAEEIARQAEIAYPAVALGARIPTETPDQRELAVVLRASPGLDLATGDVRAHFAGPGALALAATGASPTVVERVVAVQRLLQITGSATSTAKLMKDGFQDVDQLARADRAELAGALGPAAGAWSDGARAASLLDLQLVTSLRTSVDDGRGAAVHAPSSKALPTLKSLFGSQGGCPCSHCRSTLGPSAYFVDLLDFIGDAGRKVLFSRRPDLQEIELSCENTHTELKTIDLVNEILEREARAAWAPVPQTTWSSSDLEVQPEHVLDAAYELTEKEKSRWTLPFDRAAAIGRVYLGALGTDRVALARMIAPDIHRWSADAQRAVASEQLGLMPEDDLATDAPNLPNLKLVSVAQRLGLDVASAKSAVEMEYVRGSTDAANGPRVVFSKDAPCDLEAAAVEGLDDGARLRLHRLVRVHHTTSLALEEINAALSRFDKGDWNAAIVELGHAIEVARTLHLSLKQALVLFQPLDTTSRGGNESDYDRAVRPRAAVRSDTSDPLAPDALAGKSFVSLRSALAAALGLAEEHLLAIEAASSRLGIATQLSDRASGIAAVSRVHALARLAGALRAEVPAIVAVAELCALNPLSSPSTASHFLEQWRLVVESPFSPAQLSYLIRGQDRRTGTEQRRAQDRLVAVALAAVAKLGAGQIAADAKTKRRAVMDAWSAGLGIAPALLDAVLELDPTDAARAGLMRWVEGLTGQPQEPWASSADAKAIEGMLGRLEKLAVVARTLSLRGDEVAPLGALGLRWADLDATPTDQARRLAGLLAVAEVVRRREASGSATAFPALAGATFDDLAQWAGWGSAERALLAKPPAEQSPLFTVAWLARLERGLRALHLPLSSVMSWAIAVWSAEPEKSLRLLSHDKARGIRDGLRASRGPNGFGAAAIPIEDALRVRRRDALLAYLLGPRGYDSEQAVFRKLLVDVAVTAAPVTSRLKLAVTTVQMFIERALLGLEKTAGGQDILDARQAEQWTAWLSRYRVWEANRKIFLYPENWIEPELRDDKTPLFRELEQSLAQNDLTEEVADAAFRKYLEELDAISRLEVLALHDTNPDAPLQAPSGTLHIVARTRNEPHRYFHRTRNKDTLRYTPWEAIELDLSGDWVMPVVWHRRLHLFWLVIASKTEEPTRKPSSSSDAPEDAKRYFEITLCWSERQGDRWSPKRTSKQPLKCKVDELLPKFPRNPAFLEEARQRAACRLRSEAEGELLVDVGFEFEWRASTNLGPVGAAGEEVVSVASHTSVKRVVGSFGVGSCSGGTIECVGGQNFREANSDGDFPFFGGEVTYERNHASGQGPLVSSFAETVLGASNGPWRAIQSTDRTFDPWSGFVYEDAGRSFIARRALAPIGAPKGTKTPKRRWAKGKSGAMLPGSKVPGKKDVDGPRTVLSKAVSSPQEIALLRFEIFHHPHTCTFLSRLLEGGLETLFARPVQFLQNPSSTSEYAPDPSVVDVARWPVEDVDFTFGGAYSAYNWEIFFHAPVLIAAKLARAHRFREALRWYRLVFDPAATSVKHPVTSKVCKPPQNYWRFKPFFDETSSGVPVSVGRLLAAANGSSQSPEAIELGQQLTAWLADPFDPHAIAQVRHVAYEIATVMRVLDVLIGWGDQLFRQETLESVQEATLLYMLAGELLGDRPKSVSASDPQPTTYRKLLATPASGVGVVAGVPSPSASTGAYDALRSLRLSAFCLSPNDKLLSYWDTVDDRLFKLRHSMNLAGVVRRLALFEPPIDPSFLARARSAGLDISRVVAGVAAPLGAYRFTYLMQKALELAGEVRSLGAALLVALEKRDAESLAALRAKNEVAVLRAVRSVKERQLAEATKALDPLDRRKALVELRYAYYRDIERVSELEAASLGVSEGAIVLQAVGQALQMASAPLASAPGVSFGAAGWSSPVFITTYGPQNVSDGLDETGRALQAMGSVMQSSSGLMATMAGYQRRWDEWKLQENLAEKELEEIEQQRLVAQIRVDIMKRDFAAHDRQIESAMEALDIMETKFTRAELYDWMVERISAVHFQAYELALAMAKRVERAFIFERRGKTAEGLAFVSPGYWDSLHKGLLAGEHLVHDLRRLESAYIEENKRDYEITKHVSLAKFDPVALTRLKKTGYCFVRLPNEAFDADHPRMHTRRLKHVTMSVPCVTGPYVSVNATLALVNSRFVDGEGKEVRDVTVPVADMVTSGTLNESGVFEPSLRDERYLPFEGAGADSTWYVELAQAQNAFDIQSISDIVLHVRYTARGAPGAGLATASETPAAPNGRERVLMLRSDFPDAWFKLSTWQASAPANVELTLPFSVLRLTLFIVTKDVMVAVDPAAITANGVALELKANARLGGTLAAEVPSVQTSSGVLSLRVDIGKLPSSFTRSANGGLAINPEKLIDIGILVERTA